MATGQVPTKQELDAMTADEKSRKTARLSYGQLEKLIEDCTTEACRIYGEQIKKDAKEGFFPSLDEVKKQITDLNTVKADVVALKSASEFLKENVGAIRKSVHDTQKVTEQLAAMQIRGNEVLAEEKKKNLQAEARLKEEVGKRDAQVTALSAEVAKIKAESKAKDAESEAKDAEIKKAKDEAEAAKAKPHTETCLGCGLGPDEKVEKGTGVCSGNGAARGLACNPPSGYNSHDYRSGMNLCAVCGSDIVDTKTKKSWKEMHDEDRKKESAAKSAEQKK